MNGDDEQLLRLEADAIYGLTEEPGRSLPGVRDPKVRAVWSWSPRARVFAVRPDTAEPEGWPERTQPYAPGEPPRALERLAEETGAAPAAVSGGPSYVFPATLAAPPPASLPLIASDEDGKRAAAALTRPSNWEPGEWGELIAGELGEWAMAVHDRAPVSICFSPAKNATAAEAGIWTRADFRGRRLAPAVVAAWSERERRNKQVLFYSTSAANHASQSVARTLGLTPLGWIWTLR
ncbi:GNAT family N-acetyltransferase [Streptomyces varsoviensis]|uniref:GNAT family N-acetyltransferase n=1 Tax=Streptomyces varsoviensis TaxID=67373 RepID=UPI0033C22A24